MIYRTRFLIVIFFLASEFTVSIYAQPILFVKSSKENYSLGRYLLILKDKENKLSINEVASDSMKNKYVFYNKETLDLKFTKATYWLRFVVVDTLSYPASSLMASQNNRTWILIKNDPLIADVRVYYRELNSVGNKFIEKKAGSVIPIRDKYIKTNDFIARFSVQKNMPDTVYLRVQTNSQLIISFNMLTTGEYVILSSNKSLFYGIIFGILFLLIVYNTLLYFSIKEMTYIFYVLYIIFYAVFLFTYEGYYFEIFGRTFYHDYIILPVAAVTCVDIFGLLFTREFLSTKLYLPWAYKLLPYLTLVGPINFILIFALGSPIMLALWAGCNLGLFILGFVIAIITLKKGVYLSKYYLLASSGLIFGILIFITSRNNLLPLPLNFWTQNALHLGVLWEALVLAATVGYRFNFLKAVKEKEKAIVRSQIAADLHDEVGSNLSTISLQSRLMMKTQKLDDNLTQQLQEIANTANITTDIIRDIVWFINPFHDKSEDLLIRMKELASKMLINLDYSFTSNGSNENIFDLLPDLNKRRHVYLIFKEILNNVIKHSEANEASISLSIENKTLILIVSDNGKGFHEEEIIKGEGLKNLRSRAAQIGAQILIECNSGKGTKIILEIPF
ncbi:MAG: sensor histidine kinase [Ignavibacteriaceae bacterium]